MHFGLYAAIQEEHEVLVLAMQIKALGILTRNCTYDRLSGVEYRMLTFSVMLSKFDAETSTLSPVLDCFSALEESGFDVLTIFKGCLLDCCLKVLEKNTGAECNINVVVSIFEFLSILCKYRIEAIMSTFYAYF